MAQQPGMASRTVTISSLGKTFGFTGWKVGWTLAQPPLTRRAASEARGTPAAPAVVAASVEARRK